MRRIQLANRIGNIDERLLKATETYKREKRRSGKILRKCLATAAVFALMLSSATVGALAFSRETVVEVEKLVEVPVEVERIVEVAVERVVKVPVGQETLTLEDIGITLILPDSWKGKYALEYDESGTYSVYIPHIRDAISEEVGYPVEFGGMLFYITLLEDLYLTKDEAEDQYNAGWWGYAPYEYIMTTNKGTYLLYHVCDVEFTQETAEEYFQMEEEIKDIRFVLDNALTD